jgi:hypothetical protein
VRRAAALVHGEYGSKYSAIAGRNPPPLAHVIASIWESEITKEYVAIGLQTDQLVPIMAVPSHIAFAMDSFWIFVSMPWFMRLICLLIVGMLLGRSVPLW